ncbi:hypothetical protein [Nocardiopsis sp. LDBS1602]|uniref:hypothetical protein n=1 Tax=Nocardiopsis sp. LDBS1602 TaxID=3109597 RepID=UPI002DB95AD2|nr:hypothetical protein [Nocardiopsis sp. LDBS1602]MEC3893571.1 hypothetical protein [Nocardiopsis sp. LDBS1602]
MEPESWPEPICHVGAAAEERLRQLDVTPEELWRALHEGLAEARTCTELDGDATAGFLMWSRSNRNFREQKIAQGWGFSNRNQILRCIHPSYDFAITVMSGSGRIGESRAKNGEIKAKNPKGKAIKKMLEYNQLPLFRVSGIEDRSPAVDLVPTWFLLFKREKGEIRCELSMPVEMTGGYVDKFSERILVSLPEEGFPNGIHDDLDKPDDSPESPEVQVEFRRAV